MIDEKKINNLLDYIRSLHRVAVAISGGVDSSVLAKAAQLALGKNSCCVIAQSELLDEKDLNDAKKISEMIHSPLEILPANDLANENIVKNEMDRCYFCKKSRFTKLIEWTKQHNIDFILEGSNLDDNHDFRPGKKAIQELSQFVVSPFLVCGFCKKEIRELAKFWNLPVWNKASSACLASRVEYGIRLNKETLEKISLAEKFLRENLFNDDAAKQIRVRVHEKNLVRIEIDETLLRDENFIKKFFALRNEIQKKLKSLGFSFITFDLNGYRQGSFN